MNSLSVIALFVVCAAAAPAEFEVATVKPTPPGSGEPVDIRFEPGGRLIVTNQPLAVMVRYAYGVKRWQISNAPGWFDTDRFDISAKADGNPNRDEMLKMFQALLEERFKMSIRRETKEGPVYDLIVVKGGPKLAPAQPLKENEHAGVFTYSTGSPQQAAASYARVGKHATMAMLASALEDQAKRPVIDKTGLKGEFDFRVEFAADDSHLDEFASFFTAVQEQLGLKLESTKGPVETLIVEHPERVPAEN